MLASSRAAQAELRSLELAWIGSSLTGRGDLEPRLRAFLVRFPNDDGCRLARVYLAFIVMAQGDVDRATSLVAPVREGALGAVRDLALVAEAGILVRQNRARDALATLEPLSGRIVETHERALYFEHLVHAAVEGGEYPVALRAMEAWLVDAPAAQRDEVQATIDRLLERCPLALAEATAVALDARAAAKPKEPLASGRDYLRRALRGRLIQEALAGRDAELAQRLIAHSPAALLRDTNGEALIALAATGVVAPRVVGRAIGVVLSLASADTRRRSAAMVAGVSRELRLASGAAEVRMATRDDGGEPNDMATALATLAGEGASVLVAGVDPDGARRALAFATLAAIPVLVLSVPDRPPPADGYGFVLGVDDAAVERTLVASLTAAAPGTMPVEVGGDGVPCDAEVVAGRSRFPVAEWRRTGTPLLLTGDGACVRDVLMAGSQAGYSGIAGVDLDGAEGLAGISRAPPTLVARIGRFPKIPVTDSTLSLYQVLGHDAAVLAAAALDEIPTDRVEGQAEVARIHRRIRDRLATAEGELWSAASPGFAGGRVLERTLEVVPLTGETGTAP
ncbi:MAG: hypothetical protein JW751_32555 [Polyangiaceae bacterium]|nr:hypothetical protein [Polyangiaceae bacterium]